MGQESRFSSLQVLLAPVGVDMPFTLSTASSVNNYQAITQYCKVQQCFRGCIRG